MRIHYCSDLHLEFGPIDNRIIPSGELLLLCGDIGLTGALREYGARKRYMDEARFNMDAFVEAALKRFKRIVWFPGNHEAYGDNWTDIVRLLREAYPEIESGYYGTLALMPGYKLWYGTLWTDLNGGEARPELNDYRKITYGDSGILQFCDTAFMHAEQLGELKRTIAAHPNDKFVVATHHCPHHKCLNNARYTVDGNTEFGYYTDLSEFIKATPQISDWICGHTHKRTWFNCGKTMVRMNCRGYVGHEIAADNFRFRSFKVGE